MPDNSWTVFPLIWTIPVLMLRLMLMLVGGAMPFAGFFAGFDLQKDSGRGKLALRWFHSLELELDEHSP